MPELTVFIVTALLIGRCKAYTTCWDGTNAVDYTGTISMTSSGINCQPWADNSPHTHTLHGGSPLFPYDGSDAAASNYCRDPDGTAGVPYCYTMNPSVTTEACSIPTCTNLPCSDGTVVGVSDPSTVATFLDAYTVVDYLLLDAAYQITCCGTVQEWRVFTGGTGDIRFQVWRDVGGTFELIGENVYTVASGNIAQSVPQADRISVEEGDYIGWYNDNDLVAYAAGATLNNILLFTLSAAPSIGDIVDFTGASAGNLRDYAIGAVLANSVAPYFTNTATTLTVTTALTVSTVVYTLTYTDDDTGDVSTLALTMDTDTYFDLIGADVTVKTTLVIGTRVLNFTVTDRCGLTGVFTLNVTIDPVAVSISSLPKTDNVSESATTETLVHTLTFSPAGTYTCTLDAYTPTRAEGNPFMYQSTPTIGIYLKSAANIRYSVTTSYNVTVTCTEASTASDTSYLIVNVDPNSAPVFSSFQASSTFSASTALATTVYTATVTDAESDPIVMTLTCDPTGGFVINNNGEITVTADLMAASQLTYTWILTADDGFNTVTSSNISVIITGLSIAPVITNLDDTATVLENQAAGTFVFHVSQTDANVGDTPTFSATFPTAACSSMYDISSTDGSVTTLVSLDFETDPSCTLVVTVFDGLSTSNSATLTIDVSDVDEPPVMSNTGYVINTDEVAAATALPDASISATDPETTAVSLTLNCGTDSGYLTIHATTGIVTMAAAYDLEAAGIDTYTISCVVTATDATSQTSTATLNVIISDGNDVAPVFVSASYNFYITAGFSGFVTIGTVSATDGDRTSPNNLVTYSISPTTEFNVGGDGTITNVADLSAVAAGTSYTLTATATDGGTSTLTDTATVVVTVVSSTTAVATSSSSSSSTSFFSDIGNILLIVVACLTALMVAALLGCLIWRCCFKTPNAGVNGNHHITKVNPNQNSVQEFPKKINNNSNGHPPPKPQLYKVTDETKPVHHQRPSYENTTRSPNKPETHKKAEPQRRAPTDWNTQHDMDYDRSSSPESGISVSSGRMFKKTALENYRKGSPTRSLANITLQLTKTKKLNAY